MPLCISIWWPSSSSDVHSLSVHPTFSSLEERNHNIIQSYVLFSFHCNCTGPEEAFNQHALSMLPHKGSGHLCSREEFKSHRAFHQSCRTLGYNWVFICFIVATQAFPWILKIIFCYSGLFTTSVLCFFNIHSPTFVQLPSTPTHKQAHTHFSLCLHCIIAAPLQRGQYQQSEMCVLRQWTHVQGNLAENQHTSHDRLYMPWGVHDSLNCSSRIKVHYLSTKWQKHC